METIKIKYHDPELEKISKLDVGDWIDLRASQNMTIPEGTFALIPLGVSMELPQNFEAHLAPRSSTFKNFGLVVTNSIGIIDNSYRGQWMLAVYALGATAGVKKNDRICQFRIMEVQPGIQFEEVEELSDTSRGSGGFGSTGT